MAVGVRVAHRRIERAEIVRVRIVRCGGGRHQQTAATDARLDGTVRRRLHAVLLLQLLQLLHLLLLLLLHIGHVQDLDVIVRGWLAIRVLQNALWRRLRRHTAQVVQTAAIGAQSHRRRRRWRMHMLLVLLMLMLHMRLGNIQQHKPTAGNAATAATAGRSRRVMVRVMRDIRWRYEATNATTQCARIRTVAHRLGTGRTSRMMAAQLKWWRREVYARIVLRKRRKCEKNQYDYFTTPTFEISFLYLLINCTRFLWYICIVNIGQIVTAIQVCGFALC